MDINYEFFVKQIVIHVDDIDTIKLSTDTDSAKYPNAINNSLFQIGWKAFLNSNSKKRIKIEDNNQIIEISIKKN